MNRTLLIGSLAVVLIVGILIFAPPSGNSPANVVDNLAPSALAAETQNYDFGTVSMAAGIVSYKTAVKNTGASPVTLTRFYTSCMCTEGKLTFGSPSTGSGQPKKVGPFGMPGHGGIGIIKANETLAPGEEAELEIFFDPAAHGPAGIGRIERVVTIETDSGKPLEVAFAATVTP